MIDDFAWHHDHDVLLTVLWRPYEDRLAEIILKPTSEQPRRLRCYQRVRGELPAPVLAAGRALVEAARAWIEAKWAWEEALTAHAPAIAKLHAQECPDCPWDGRTIFPATP